MSRATSPALDRHPPGPRGLPVLGHLLPFLRDKLGFLSDCVATYGDTVQLRIGEPTFLIADPEDIRHVLVTNASNYDKTRRLTSARGRRLSGHGVLTAIGCEHTRLRRTLHPPFHRDSVEDYRRAMADNTRSLLEGWRDGARIDLETACLRLTQKNIQTILFGPEFDEPDFDAAVRIRREYFEYHFRSLFPFPELIPVSIVRRHREALRVIDRVIGEQVAIARAAGSPSTLLAKLMGARDPDGSELSPEALRDEVRTLCVTGYETMGEALTWTWYLLATHPEVDRRVFEESTRAVPPGEPWTVDARELGYVERVLSESMRLFPPTWLYVRMARSADRLPSGAALPAGGKVYLCQYVVHRHPAHFENPERFDPDRFARGEPRSTFAYFPFGAGRRICLGKTLALLEGTLCLALMARSFTMKLVPGQTIVPEPGITLRPRHGIDVVIEKRPGRRDDARQAPAWVGREFETIEEKSSYGADRSVDT